jgi:hypothetical protein
MGSNWDTTFTNVISQYFQWIPSWKIHFGRDLSTDFHNRATARLTAVIQSKLRPECI